ncbi:asparagine synthase [Dictyocaulus viviparus]|uniref:Asparagine synthase n=1 Tax=Dictyocaulus viviparus TaxID=29172 RepID=A0A0D8XFZ6_DICVI|nr:asparagine synthase [Dictyocaulus viviparus]
MRDEWRFLISTRSFYERNSKLGILNADRLLILSGEVVEEPPDLFHSIDPVEITQILMRRAGPWSVIYHRPDLSRIFVGRDVFGRLSLVFAPVDNDVMISDVVRSIPLVQPASWHEVPHAQISRSIFCTRQKALKDFFERLLDAVRSMIPQGVERLAVAFSGGVDSLLIAIALHKVCQFNQSIDLINVAFIRDSEESSLINDRLRGITGMHHLRSRYCDRRWRLILVDVTKDELEANRSFIAKAAAPANSVLDESIACVLWFALRGTGKDFDSHENLKQYIRSDAHIYFVGSGADELFGGYARHRKRFQCDGLDSLVEECENELHRYGYRNGGRDARVAVMLMRKLRAPFLHDSFVAWANTLPMELKCDLTLPRGIGEKLIVRQVLAQLGAPHTAPKQAMQFGSGFVKMQDDKTLKGSSLSRHLCHSQQIVRREC